MVQLVFMFMCWGHYCHGGNEILQILKPLCHIMEIVVSHQQRYGESNSSLQIGSRQRSSYKATIFPGAQSKYSIHTCMLTQANHGTIYKYSYLYICECVRPL